MTRGLLLRVWQEPLTRFLLLGAAIFGADHALHGTNGADSGATRIVVTATQQTALRESFRSEFGRQPQPGELQARLDRWIDEQLLYREALARGLDRKDAIVQRQLTQKMRFLLEDAVPLPEPQEAELEAWLAEHAADYGRAPALSFEQIFVSRGRHGAGLVREAGRIAAQLERAPAEFVGLGDPFLVGQVVQGADEDQLRRDFGPAFARAVQSLADGAWSEPVASSFGLHLVRITQRTAFELPALAAVRERVALDWRNAQRERLNRQAMQRLRQQYRIEIEGSKG